MSEISKFCGFSDFETSIVIIKRGYYLQEVQLLNWKLSDILKIYRIYMNKMAN